MTPSKQQHGPGRDDELDAEGGLTQAKPAQRDEDVDALLDEIDDVLEQNAEAFVKGFVQKGGE